MVLFNEGVPPYPLYKRITLALWETLCSGTFCPMYKRMLMKNGESSLKQKEEIWMKLIIDKGSEMVQVTDRCNFLFVVTDKINFILH